MTGEIKSEAENSKSEENTKHQEQITKNKPACGRQACPPGRIKFKYKIRS